MAVPLCVMCPPHVEHVLLSVSAEPPEWLSEPESQLSMIGSDVLIKCSVSGTPQPTVTWRVNGDPLQGQSRHPLT